MLVGDSERERAVASLRGAYAGGYLDSLQLERRVDRALQARTAVELVSSVRGVPGATLALALETVVRPAIRVATLPLRRRLGLAVVRLAIGAWALTTALVAVVAGLWALTAALPLGAGIALALVWLSVSALGLAGYRLGRRLLRP